MSRWKTGKHFSSWLGLCPDSRTSGGKVLKRGTRRVVNRAATALRQAACLEPDTEPKHTGRKVLSPPIQTRGTHRITVMTHTLARLVYRMLKFGQRYVDQGIEYYEAKYRQ